MEPTKVKMFGPKQVLAFKWLLLGLPCVVFAFLLGLAVIFAPAYYITGESYGAAIVFGTGLGLLSVVGAGAGLCELYLGRHEELFGEKDE